MNKQKHRGRFIYIISESQYGLLTESLSIEVRRRFPYKNLRNDMEYGVLDEMINPCEYENVEEFIGNACDSLVEMYHDYFVNDFDYVLTSKDKDSLYNYFVDFFGEFLVKYYNNSKCSYDE
jgi:hypothetical protein